MSGKYEPLYEHLKRCRSESVPMSFAEIERIVGAPLPPSAFKQRAWWSNNPSNNVMTNAWLKAGFETEQVNMASKRLVFRRTRKGTAAEGGAGSSLGPKQSLFGALKGTIRIAPGTDLTKPTGVRWAALGELDED